MIKRFLIITCMAVGLAGFAVAQESSTHTVRPGETLYRIATTNGMSVDELKRLNGLEGDVIHVGQVLRLSAASEIDADTPGAGDQEAGADVSGSREAEADVDVSPPRERGVEVADTTARREAPDEAAALAGRGITTHIARPGETLYSIAADHGTKAYILFTLNNGVRAPLEAGTPVVVPVPGAAAGDGPMQGGTRTYAVGSVTVFPDAYAGRVMAGGAAYVPDEFVVAHRELPFGTVLIVENAETGRASFARVADRGPQDDRRVMEISPALASEIGVGSGGRVRIRLVE